jgi:FkbM family methyltransferase|tara:strand:+ start:298 stop:951 length:654 start_codon:yes stop_codon:yes gene_type:complete
MLMNIEELVSNHSMDINGVIHIGAHYGDEYEKFRSVGVTDFLMFEPHPDNFNKLKEYTGQFESDDSTITLENIALGHRPKENCTMYVETANKSMSCSLLKPLKHLELYPQITFDSTIEVNQTSLDAYFEENDIDISKFNMINIDVQGYELEVFKGALNSLFMIDYVMTEVNLDELYEGCPMMENLDEFLGDLFGFKRVAQRIVGNNTWGDALYIKEK